MNWLLKLFGLGKKELAPAPIHHEIESSTVGATWFPDPLVPKFSMQDVFLDAIQEVHEETYRAELELLDDEKLRNYIKNVIKAISVGVNKDAYEFVLIRPHDVRVPPASWELFCGIMIGLFETINLKVTNEGNYMKVMKKDVKKSFRALKRPVVDIDERTRAMLSQGIYR